MYELEHGEIEHPLSPEALAAHQKSIADRQAAEESQKKLYERLLQIYDKYSDKELGIAASELHAEVDAVATEQMSTSEATSHPMIHLKAIAAVQAKRAELLT